MYATLTTTLAGTYPATISLKHSPGSGARGTAQRAVTQSIPGMGLNISGGDIAPYLGFGKIQDWVYLDKPTLLFYFLVIYPCLPFGAS
jgi:hypothetical protein